MGFRNVMALGEGGRINGIQLLKAKFFIRYLLRALGDEPGRIWEGSLEEVTCVLAMDRIRRVTWREKQLNAEMGRKA